MESSFQAHSFVPAFAVDPTNAPVNKTFFLNGEKNMKHYNSCSTVSLFVVILAAFLPKRDFEHRCTAVESVEDLNNAPVQRYFKKDCL